MLGRGVNEAVMRSGAFREPLKELLPILERADVRIGNLECALTRSQKPWRRYEKAFYFGADPRMTEVLTCAKIDGVSLANNHVLDFEEEGLLDTLFVLDKNQIGHAGAGHNLIEARQPVLLPVTRPVAQRKVALLSATDNEPGFAASQTKPGTHYFPIDLDVAGLAWLDEAIAESRSQGAEIVVLSLHWGPNMVTEPSPVFRKFAQAAIDRGVDVVHGHSSHVFQGIEIYREKPILYDTGDVLDDYAVDPELRNDWSFLFQLRFSEKELESLELFPLQLEYGYTRLATGPARKEIIQRMKDRSADLGTRFIEEGNLFRVDLGRTRAA